MGWERALKLSTEDISEVFKTVSKTAVQNLSPSKCRTITTPNETENDIDNYSNDSDIQDVPNSTDGSKDHIQDDLKDLNTNVRDSVQNGDCGKTDSIKDDSSKTDSKFSDPLHDFSEVDLL